MTDHSRFQRWYSEELRIGSADDFKVFLGQEGVGKNSFASFQCHALPEDEPVLAKLIYEDKEGEEHNVNYKLKERCSGMLYHGPVRVPEDARPGKAVVRMELSEQSKFESLPTDIEVMLVAAAAE